MHLELTEAFSAKSFLQTFRCFISRCFKKTIDQTALTFEELHTYRSSRN